MLAGVTSAEYVEPPGGAGDVVSGGEGAGREEPCLVRIHSGPKCMVVVVILLAAEKSQTVLVARRCVLLSVQSRQK